VRYVAATPPTPAAAVLCLSSRPGQAASRGGVASYAQAQLAPARPWHHPQLSVGQNLSPCSVLRRTEET
jgi:hypothetical protein